MSRHDKLLAKILEGKADASIRFSDLRLFLQRLGYVERIRGSHHLFRHSEFGGRLNLQRDGSQAKPYQVRQVRTAIIKHGLGGKP